MGTDEVGYSNVTKTESRRGWGFGRGACGPGGGYICILPGNVTDKREFSIIKTCAPPLIRSDMITELPEINNVNRMQGNISKRPGSWSSWL